MTNCGILLAFFVVSLQDSSVQFHMKNISQISSPRMYSDVCKTRKRLDHEWRQVHEST
jgi:hypothetical protein